MQSTNGKRPASTRTRKSPAQPPSVPTTSTELANTPVAPLAEEAIPAPALSTPSTPPSSPSPKTLSVAPPTPPEAEAEAEAEPQETAMQVSIDAELLLKALERATAATSKDSNASPALRSVYVKAEGDSLRITGYDFRTWITVQVEAEVKQAGEFLLQPKSLLELLKATGQNGRLVLDSATSPGTLTLEYGEIRYSERVESTDNYPELPRVEEATSIQRYVLPTSDLSHGLGAVVFAADPEEGKAFNTIVLQLWRGDDTSLTDGFILLSTNGGNAAAYQVTEKEHDLNNPQHQVYLPPKAVAAIRQLCFAAQETVVCTVDPTGNLLYLETEVPQLDERAPLMVQSVIRLKEVKDYPTRSIQRVLSMGMEGQVQADLPYQQFLAAISRQMATEATAVLIEVGFDGVCLKTLSKGGRERQVTETLSAETKRTGTIPLPINPLNKAVWRVPCETVRMLLSSHASTNDIGDGHEDLAILRFVDRPLTVLMTRLISPAPATTVSNSKKGKGKNKGR